MHNNWEELIPFYIAGTLPKAEAARLESHVAHCDDCRKSLDEWRQIASVVRADAASQLRDLPPLSARVLQVANGQASVRRYGYIPPVTPQPTRSYRGTSITLLAAVVTVVLIGGLLTLMLMRAPQPQQGVALLPSPTATVNTATAESLAPTSTLGEAASLEATTAQASLQPQIIVIEPSATPVSPTPTLGAPTAPPSAAPTYVVPTLVYPTPLRLPTRVYPTAIPFNNQQPQAQVTQPTPESSQDVQPLYLAQSQSACTLQVAQPSSIVNLYAGAGTDYPVVRTFSSDDQLLALGRSDDGWYKAQYEPGSDQSVGWVQQALVVTSGNCGSLPLISVTTNTLPTPT
ncbi:MAG TPA: zf-HC2 domain-containing protein, partial [Phototrophicaceae bacterium]|nr:zf-HC2 domain-containing protein [Phototrophicaceae bacterium]